MFSEEVLDALSRTPALYGAALVLGALLGSFASVCVYRIPKGKSIVSPPSHCYGCNRPIRWFDNVPILSYLLLGGKCRSCGARYSPRYLLVEVGLALLSLATYHFCVELLHPFDPTPLKLARFAVYLLFELCLVVIALIDLDHMRIPDRITYPAIPFFFGVGLLLRDRPWTDGLIGIAVGYGVVRLISDGYYFLTRREGLGYGDGKLLAIVGGLLGWRAVVMSLFGGSLFGSVIGIAVVAWRRRKRTGDDAEQPSLRHVELPFGPFLVLAALMYLFLQDTLSVALRAFIPVI
ncbi:MAG: prepilin peptidase [Deltaproteobacteria bacterium]|nr:prepilin peptidase [Deltaproteobacteria bacterium]